MTEYEGAAAPTGEEIEGDYMAARRAEVSQVVGKLIARAWIDEDFKRELIADPQRWLKAEGLHFPDRYIIEFHEDPSAKPGDWSSIGRGSRAVHRFPIPPRPEEGEQDSFVQESLVVPPCCSPCASCTGAVSPGTWY